MAEDKKIKGNEDELNSLFKETLDGLRDDLTEADENVQLYLQAILNDPGGKELYGSLYNDALKIKGSSRDRFLKFLGLIKDRVGKKEDMALKKKEETGSEFAVDHGELNTWVERIKQQAEGENVKPFIEPKTPTQPVNEPRTRTEPESESTDEDELYLSDEYDEDEDGYDEGGYDEED